jgi:hypothetical protein
MREGDEAVLVGRQDRPKKKKKSCECCCTRASLFVYAAIRVNGGDLLDPSQTLS